MFVELAENDPRFVRKHLSHVVDAMMTVAEHNDLEVRSPKCRSTFSSWHLVH